MSDCDPNARRSKLKHRAWSVSGFLLLGAVATWIVAWSCILIWPRHMNQQGERLLSDAENMKYFSRNVFRITRFDPANYDGFEYSAVGWTYLAVEPLEWDGGNYEFVALFQFSAGWPFRALRGRHWDSAEQSVNQGVLFLPEWIDDRYWQWRLVPFLPCYPILLGFVADAVVYAGLLWLLFRGPSFLKRHLRSKRGHCAHCDYDLRGLKTTVCPECGHSHSARFAKEQPGEKPGQSPIFESLQHDIGGCPRLSGQSQGEMRRV